MIRFARCALLVLAVSVAGCSAEATPAASSSPPAAALSAAGVAFVAQARRIAPQIVGDDERLAARGEDTCTALTDGRPREQVVAAAVDRFSSGSYTVTSAQAAQLVEAAQATVCAS